MSKKAILSLFLVAAGLLSSGCQPNDGPAPTSDRANHDDHHEHDHADGHPETLSEAIAEVERIGNTVLTAFSEGKPDDAHDQLHEIGHSIECLPELVAQSELPDDAKKSIAEATEKLMDAFGSLDDSLHGGDAVDLKTIKADVKQAIDSVRSKLELAE